MSAGALAAAFTVPVVGALTCSAPVVTRPTLQFGVRVPRERAGAPVIRRERRAYYWRTAAIGVCCTVVAVAVQGYWPSWLIRIILLPELAADLGLLYLNRDDPAVMVGSRFGVGWTFNLGNPGRLADHRRDRHRGGRPGGDRGGGGNVTGRW
jgi:uncharacterized membrane protein